MDEERNLYLIISAGEWLVRRSVEDAIERHTKEWEEWLEENHPALPTVRIDAKDIQVGFVVNNNIFHDYGLMQRKIIRSGNRLDLFGDERQGGILSMIAGAVAGIGGALLGGAGGQR